MSLRNKDKQHYYNLKKGYEGELLFDSLTQNLESEVFILNDLLFKLNQTVFQIDSLIITSETIYLFEVKNYEGDYYYDSDRLYKRPKTEISNPLNQLRRNESLLRQLLENLKFDMPISGSVVFINPEFTLYQAPINTPFIFPTQVRRYLKNLNSSPSHLNGKHKLLADKLISLHIKDSPYKLLPSYDYELLRKGLTCEKCASFSVIDKEKFYICSHCGHEEGAENALMRSVKEFQLLFPDWSISTNIIHEWCNAAKSKKSIRRILRKNFKAVGVHQWTFYE
ncbi:NERD domain-containing protein [Peribacillus sp. SCS-155]|uniref:NERD domain-containing protein n=1 Tax=Peribacillus sedimenti TaxID=3115297 RepID=UPI003906AF8B